MRKQYVPGVSPPPSQTPGYEAKQPLVFEKCALSR